MLNSNTPKETLPGTPLYVGVAVAVKGCNTARVLFNFQASLFHNIHKKVIEIREMRLFSWKMFTENCFDAIYCDKTPQKSFLDGE